jgi:integrase
VRAAGVRYLKFHSLRHLANVLALERGENLLTITQRMGWTTSRMALDTYGHVTATMQLAALARLNAATTDGSVVGRRVANGCVTAPNPT